MVDASDSKSDIRESVGVQVPSPVFLQHQRYQIVFAAVLFFTQLVGQALEKTYHWLRKSFMRFPRHYMTLFFAFLTDICPKPSIANIR